MFWIQADLHIHSTLSPCADDEMTPCAIVDEAKAARLDLIAICDHNSAGNVAAIQAIGEKRHADLAIIAGMEITTAEEAHILGIFPSARQAESAARQVQATLPYTAGAAKLYGNQCLWNTRGEQIGEERRLLSAASSLPLNAAIRLIHQHRGIAIAAHIDRPSFSVTSQLGFIPVEARFDALELSAHAARDHREDYESRYTQSLIASSDAHFLSDIGCGRCLFHVEALSLEEITLALDHAKGRSCALA